MSEPIESGPGEGAPPPFLEGEPPPWAARGLTYLLILLFGTAAIAAVVVRVPETVSAPFVLVPARGTDPVRAARDGVIAEVAAGEGGVVSRGDALFTIRSQPVGDRFAELRSLQAERKGAEDRLANERQKFGSQRLADAEQARTLRSRSDHLDRIIALQESQSAAARELAERYRRGYAEGMVSYVEFSRAQMAADRLGVELEQVRSDHAGIATSLAELQHASAARDAEFREMERSLREAMATADIRIAALERDLGTSTDNEIRVIAPCSGTILRLRVNRTGAVVQEGDVLCELACTGERLQADLSVPPSKTGQLRAGQSVKLLYDAFPYQRYGVRFGRLRWISPAAVEGPEGPVLRALADVSDAEIRVRDGMQPLRPGMGGTAEVVVGRRSLASYAFEPIRELKESVAAEPGS